MLFTTVTYFSNILHIPCKSVTSERLQRYSSTRCRPLNNNLSSSYFLRETFAALPQKHRAASASLTTAEKLLQGHCSFDFRSPSQAGDARNTDWSANLLQNQDSYLNSIAIQLTIFGDGDSAPPPVNLQPCPSPSQHADEPQVLRSLPLLTL